MNEVSNYIKKNEVYDRICVSLLAHFFLRYGLLEVSHFTIRIWKCKTWKLIFLDKDLVLVT